MDSADDLLDRNEAVELVGVESRSWDRYANLSGMRPRPDPVDVAGVEHWRRGDIQAWLAGRPGPGSSPGRPIGSQETAPRADTRARAAELLEREPAITAAAAAAELGVSADTAQRTLARARAAAVGQLLQENPGLTAADVHERLGYPRWAVQRALTAAGRSSDRDA